MPVYRFGDMVIDPQKYPWGYSKPEPEVAPFAFHADSVVSVHSTSGMASIDVPAPIGLEADDLILISIAGHYALYPNPIEGFTFLVAGIAGSSSTPYVAVYWKIATNDEPLAYSVPLSSTSGFAKTVTTWRVSGATIAEPIGDSAGVSSGSSSWSTVVLPSLLASETPAILFAQAGSHGDQGNINTPPEMTGFFEQLDGGSGGTTAIAFEDIGGVGDTGSRTFTWPTARRSCGVIFIIK